MAKQKQIFSLNRLKIFLKFQHRGISRISREKWKVVLLILIVTSVVMYFIFLRMQNLFGLRFQDLPTEKGEEVSYSYAKNEIQSQQEVPSMTPKLVHKKEANFVKDRLSRAEAIWQKSIDSRNAYIQSQGGLSKVDPWSVVNSVYYWDFFTPSFNCPHLVQRVGRISDGGKWVCGFELFESGQNQNQNQEDECIVYSFGVADESSFEAQFLGETNCKIFAFDFSVDKLGPQINNKNSYGDRAKFRKIGLGHRNANETFQTLGEIMRSNEHKWIDVLKVDIEGSEFACMEQIMGEFGKFEATLPFGQLQMEIHVDHFGRGFPSVYKWWQKLENHGLRAFSSETNHHSCVGDKSNPVAVEYSFINIKGDHKIIR